MNVQNFRYMSNMHSQNYCDIDIKLFQRVVKPVYEIIRENHGLFILILNELLKRQLYRFQLWARSIPG